MKVNWRPYDFTEADKENGRKGGLKGGPSRAEKLDEQERIKIAKEGALARWGIKEKKH